MATELIEPYLEIISASLITKGCSTAQLGSTSEFLDTVLRLTRTFPNIWLTLKPKKSKPPVTIINQFVKLGSQGASDYWTKILHIIDTLPNETLPKSKGGVMEMLDAFLTGITETQEPRIHTITSWATYLGVCLRLLTLVDLEEEAKVYIIDDGIWPLYEEYLRQEGTRKKYILHASYRTAVCAGGLLKLLGPNPALEEEPNVFGNNPVLQSLLEERLWGRMVDMLLSELETSGASDEEAEKRRENLEAVGDRWLGMVGELYRNMLGEGLPYEVVRTSTQKVLQACVTALETSNGINILR